MSQEQHLEGETDALPRPQKSTTKKQWRPFLSFVA